MSQAPPFDEALRQALAGLDTEEARLFLEYFEELKVRVRRCLSRKARAFPGDSAVAQSALFSLFCDLAIHDIPLADMDEYGCPMLWPLLLKYAERHCDKWNKWHQAKKRKGTEVPLATTDGQGQAPEPADHRASAGDEEDFVKACEELCARMTDEERAVFAGRLRGQTLEELAKALGRSHSTVSNRLSRIRALMETT